MKVKNEFSRILALRDYQILDTLSESKYDNITKLASYICNTPISLITLIDEDRQWIKSKTGIDVTETSRDVAFCNHTIQSDYLFEVKNTTEDERFIENPFVIGEPKIRFYAGAPLITPEGERIGALCAIDYQPQELSQQQKEALTILAKEVIAHMEMDKKTRELNKLLAEAQEFHNLFNSSNEIHCITDHEGTILFINDSVNKLLGYPVNDTLGKNIWEFCIEGERDRIMPRIYQEIAMGKENFQTEVQVKTKDNQIKWIEWSNVIKNGKWLVNGRDITQRKEIESKIKTLTIAVEKSAAGVFIRNAKNEIEWMNDSACTIIGYELNELQGKGFGNMLVGPQTDLSVLRGAQQLVAEKKPYEIELLVYKKDGTPIWLFISNNPLFDSVGELERQIGITVDITQRKHAEEQLNKTREEAIRLSKAKESFLSVMSHEMRTPLNAVVGMARILKSDEPAEHQVENLNILEFSAQNLLTIINDVLDFTKIETGNMQLEVIKFNIRSMVAKTIESLQYKAKEKDISISYEFDPRIPELIMGDPTRLYQIFMNLLGNSIKFTNKGTVKLKLELEEEMAGNAKIKFEVSDSGIGIPADKINKIFDPYAQVGSDTTRKYGGTGLGLTITKNLISLHQSRISVESELDKGSKFMFSIAFEKAIVAQNHLPENIAADALMKAKVLVVDDITINRILARKALEKWNITSDFAENGIEAIDKIKENDYDLVLMDVHMPLMGGIEAVLQIRQLEDSKYRDLPIIALSATSSSEDEDYIIASGMNDFIQKPFDPKILYKKIQRYLLKVEAES